MNAPLKKILEAHWKVVNWAYAAFIKKKKKQMTQGWEAIVMQIEDPMWMIREPLQDFDTFYEN